jgi:hypothetical protein
MATREVYPSDRKRWADPGAGEGPTVYELAVGG